MKFKIKNKSGKHIAILMRQLGYRFLKETPDNELVFIKPLSFNSFPRFHIYLKKIDKNDEFLIKIHLDQKKPIYKGVTPHSGEYDCEIIKKEVKRIENFFKNV